MFSLPELKAIGEKYGKTAAQGPSAGICSGGALSTHIERMKENLQVFNFALDEADMAAIVALDKKQSAFFSHTDPNMVEWFVKMVEEHKQRKNCGQEIKNW